MVLIALAAIALHAALGVHSWRQFAPAVLNRFGSGRLHQVSVPPPSFKVLQGTRPTLSVEKLEEVRRLFEERRFDTLNRIILETQAAFEEDPSREYEITDLFEIFVSTRPDFAPRLDAWVEAFPDLFAPHLARASYYHAMGWKSRGGAYAAETSKEQFRGMWEYFRAAGTDLETALRINPRLLAAHRIQINIGKAHGDDAEENAAFERARRLFPDSYLLYSTFLATKLPRWGGSYREMEEIARQALRQSGSNPEMYFLLGTIYMDQAWRLRKEKRFEKALALCSRAIEYGEHSYFFEERGRIYLDLKDPQHALADADRSISLRPNIEGPHRLRATVRVNLKDWEGASEDIAMAARIAPDDSDVRGWYSWAAKRLLKSGHGAFQIDLEEAIRNYDLALGFDPHHAEALYWRAVAYSRLDRSDLALADCRSAIASDPRLFEAHRLLDSLLAAQGRWEEIIGYWDRYLVLEPAKAEGYLERAGAYKHLGETNRAIADLKQACELGSPEACRLYQQVR